jgi:tetratricopeptide (TPR) repeat protein
LLPDDTNRQAQLYSRLGCIYSELADVDNARWHFAKALQLFRNNDAPNPGTALGEICRSLLRDIAQYWNLDAEWKAMIDDPDLDDLLRIDLTDARNSLTNYLDNLAQLYYVQGKYEQAEPLYHCAHVAEKTLPQGRGITGVM